MIEKKDESQCKGWNEFIQSFLNLEGVSKCISWQQLKKSFDIQHRIQRLTTYQNDMIHRMITYVHSLGR